MDQHGDPGVGALFMADIRAKDERLRIHAHEDFDGH